MDYKKAQNDLSTKGLGLVNTDTIKYSKEPIGKAHLKSRGRPKNEVPSHYTDKIKCKICGKFYTKSNSVAHKKTQIHKAYSKFDEKMRAYILEDFNQ